MRRSGVVRCGAFRLTSRAAARLPLYAALLAGLTLATGALADPYRARSSAGFASLEAVRDAVGDAQIEVACPSEQVETPSQELSQTGPHMSRGAKLTIAKAGTGYRDTAVMDSILLNALKFVVERCPMLGTDIAGNHHQQINVGFIDLYGRLHEGDEPMRLVHAGPYFGTMGTWNTVTDEGADREKQEADARAEQERTAAAEAAQRQAAAQAPPVQSEPPPPVAAPPAQDKGGGIGGFFLTVMLLALAVLGFVKRADILRFLYGLTPHPAADDINYVIRSGEPYDPDRLARLLAVPPGNAIEREVRARQAADLLRSLTAHTARTREELEEETAYLTSQAGLADAMEMHARIKNRLDTILRIQGKTA
jgi:hypothetical protein